MTTDVTISIKINDVFLFRYNEDELKTRFSPYHCFDGTLVVKEAQNGDLILQDTYWSSSGENMVFTLGKALQEGYLTFLCNLDDVEAREEWHKDYYDDSDTIHMKIHAGYRNKFFIKKGAKRSKDKMLLTIQQKIKDAEAAKRSAEYNIIKHNETLAKIQAGDLSVYL